MSKLELKMISRPRGGFTWCDAQKGNSVFPLFLLLLLLLFFFFFLSLLFEGKESLSFFLSLSLSSLMSAL